MSFFRQKRLNNLTTNTCKCEEPLMALIWRLCFPRSWNLSFWTTGPPIQRFRHAKNAVDVRFLVGSWQATQKFGARSGGFECNLRTFLKLKAPQGTSELHCLICAVSCAQLIWIHELCTVVKKWKYRSPYLDLGFCLQSHYCTWLLRSLVRPSLLISSSHLNV